MDINEEKPPFSFEDVTAGMKDKKFKKVVVLTGAALSVGAGIPDFRSPKTELSSKLA